MASSTGAWALHLAATDHRRCPGVRRQRALTALTIFLFLPRFPASGCPDVCSCFLGKVNCVDRGLRLVPLQLPMNTTTLLLEHNLIATLQNGTFAAQKALRRLSLRNNVLTSIHRLALVGLHELQDLDLSDNSLSLLHPETFLPVPTLRTLTLGDNRLLRLGPEIPRALPHLRGLFLHRNALSDLPAGFFESLPSLSYLTLEGNPWICSCGLWPLFLWLAKNRDKVPGEQFAVFRDLDGKAYVLDAYCPHLGANLAIGGRVVGNCIECPFHGWMFSGKDGNCIKIPYAKKVPEFASTKVWPSCEVNNMIMVWYHCDGTSPEWQVAEQEEVSSPNWAFRAATDHFVSVHIEEILENAADVAHLSFLHSPSVMSGNDLRFTDNHRWAFFRHTWEAEWQAEPEPNGHCSVMHLTHHLLLFGKLIPFLDLHVTARQIGPGLVTMDLRQALLGKGLIIQTVIPLEPLLQHVVHQIYYPRNMPSFLAKLVLWAEGVQAKGFVLLLLPGHLSSSFLPEPV
uniref:cholesterol 7-desaturase n=1 Tax=Naja naja TaxID=35670 RepID=A0A8C6YH76_NAJNA